MAIINNPHDGQEIRSGKSVSVISIGKLQINITQHSVYKEGKEISLTGTEFKMLYYLASNKGMALSKDQIYNFIWNGEYALDDSNITSHIRRLRVKIEDDPAQPQYIQTVRGIGYRMGT
ncbi:MAG: response regulator transcription factor [Lachnospiraceae bacterium]|nr:response regulator transcription factor [Lachnospiraceae bacterium]